MPYVEMVFDRPKFTDWLQDRMKRPMKTIQHWTERGHSIGEARVLAAINVGDTLTTWGEPCTVTKIRNDGAVFVRTHDNFEGTVTPLSLRPQEDTQ